jgi:hypothetical protein
MTDMQKKLDDMRKKNDKETIACVVAGFVLAAIVIWVLFFSPCWIFSWGTPVARCIGYFTRL